MIDSHTHLGVCEPEASELVSQARAAGVRRLLTVGLDEDSNREAIADAEAHAEVYAAVGRHPNSASGFDEAAAADIELLAAHPKVRAIGETGLDYYRDRAPRTDQRRVFEAQIEIAARVGKPLVIHMRDTDGPGGGEAVAATFALLGECAEGMTVILHCFSASAERAAEAAERGWLCSFAGNATYPKAEELRVAAAALPADLLLVETDAPFLAPQPVRGRPNVPANVTVTAEAIAAARGVEYAELEAQLEANAERVFGW